MRRSATNDIFLGRLKRQKTYGILNMTFSVIKTGKFDKREPFLHKSLAFCTETTANFKVSNQTTHFLKEQHSYSGYYYVVYTIFKLIYLLTVGFGYQSNKESPSRFFSRRIISIHKVSQMRLLLKLKNLLTVHYEQNS